MIKTCEIVAENISNTASSGVFAWIVMAHIDVVLPIERYAY